MLDLFTKTAERDRALRAVPCCPFNHGLGDVDTGSNSARKLARARGIPGDYVIISDEQFEENVVEGLAAGADDYLTKPFHLQELRRVWERPKNR